MRFRDGPATVNEESCRNKSLYNCPDRLLYEKAQQGVDA